MKGEQYRWKPGVIYPVYPYPRRVADARGDGAC